VQVQRNGGTPTSSGDVTIRPVTAFAGCIGTRPMGQVTSTNGYKLEPNGSMTMAQKQAFAFPPGDYIVCADDKAGTGGSANRREVTVSNNNENGQLVVVNIQPGQTTNGNSTGHCV
jgi:hypothetical protein